MNIDRQEQHIAEERFISSHARYTGYTILRNANYSTSDTVVILGKVYTEKEQL